MKRIIFLIIIVVVPFISQIAQTSLSATYDAVKKEYGANFRKDIIIASIKNGAYNTKLEHVSVLEFGIGYAHNLEFGSIFIIPTYNFYHNKSEKFIFFNEEKFRNISLEFGAEVNVVSNLLCNIFFDPIMGEARFGIGWQLSKKK